MYNLSEIKNIFFWILVQNINPLHLYLPYFIPSSRSGGHLRLLPRQRGRAFVPGGRHHLRDQEERWRLVRGRHERDHGPLPRQLRRVHHALRWLSGASLSRRGNGRSACWGWERGEGRVKGQRLWSNRAWSPPGEESKEQGGKEEAGFCFLFFWRNWTWQTRSFSWLSRRYKTTTTLDISFPVTFLSLWLCLINEEDWAVMGLLLFESLFHTTRPLNWFLLLLCFLFLVFLAVFPIFICSGRWGGWAGRWGFGKKGLEENAFRFRYSQTLQMQQRYPQWDAWMGGWGHGACQSWWR